MCCQGVRSLVVVIESNMRLAHSLSLLLDDWGFDALVFPSIDAALGEIGSNSERIGAIIFDQNEERTSGTTEALARLAARIGHEVPALIMTSDHDEGLASDLPVIEKPFDPKVLEHWLATNV